MARYSLRTKKIMDSIKSDPYEFEDSPNENEPFSGGSADEVHYSDMSLSDSSSDLSPGYLEVSREKLLLEGPNRQHRIPDVNDENKLDDINKLSGTNYKLNDLSDSILNFEKNQSDSSISNSCSPDSEIEHNFNQLGDNYGMRTRINSPVIPRQKKINVISQHILNNYVENENNLPNLGTISSPVSDNEIKKNNNDRILHNYGIITKETPLNKIEQIENARRWTKKNCCPYCFVEVTHFPRHLQRKHAEEGAVKDILSLTFSDPKRKLLLNALRRQGNYLLNSNAKTTRPVRRPRSLLSNEDYSACNFCLGYYKKGYLRRHRTKCLMNKNLGSSKTRISHQSETQAFTLCSGIYKEFYDSLRLKSEVIDKMRPDDISRTAIQDILICSYGESQLKRHRRVQLAVSVSNKIREMGRILLVLKDSTGIEKFQDVFKPEMFDSVVTATKVISGYDGLTHTFKAPSLALHMGTRLIHVCDIATQLIIKKNRFIDTSEPEKKLKDIKRFRALITSHWNTELSSIALKDLNEKNWEKPKLFPMTEDIINFEKFVTQRAEKAFKNIKENNNIKVEYKNLSECVLALTLLLNRKRIGEVQYLKVKTYCSDLTLQQNTEFLTSLSPQEKMLSQNFKRVVTGGKGSKPVAILFPKKFQVLIQLMLEVRANIVHTSNEYLFANPSTKDRWLSGYHVLQKLANESGIPNTDLFTSTRLRKQIATVLQVSNFSETDMEQFAKFMGHTQKTHAEYYRLPQDVYQTAKVSKILMAINKGGVSQFKGKSLNEIKVSDDELVDSENDSDGEYLPRSSKCKKENKIPTNTFSGDTNTPGTSIPITSSEVIHIPGHLSEIKNEPITKKRLIRERWTEKQKELICKHFAYHISSQKPPKRDEVEEFKKKFKNLFKDRNWVVIKACVYNIYRKK